MDENTTTKGGHRGYTIPSSLTFQSKSGSSDDTFGFGCQGLAGCTYQITRTMDLGLRYKYLGVADRTFDSLDLKMGWTHTHCVTAYFSLKF
jgi:opacity protein-like surface antigen